VRRIRRGDGRAQPGGDDVVVGVVDGAGVVAGRVWNLLLGAVMWWCGVLMFWR
jgi:hypothetical protein